MTRKTGRPSEFTDSEQHQGGLKAQQGPWMVRGLTDDEERHERRHELGISDQETRDISIFLGKSPRRTAGSTGD